MKKVTTFLLAAALIVITSCSPATTAEASSYASPNAEIILLENGDYFETTISDVPTPLSGLSVFSAASTVTKKKTTYFKNANDTVLWSVAITATFTYDGTTSKCTSCSHSTTCPSPTWKIKSASSSRSGNSATAKATATHYTGTASDDVTKSVTITCSKNGVVS